MLLEGGGEGWGKASRSFSKRMREMGVMRDKAMEA